MFPSSRLKKAYSRFSPLPVTLISVAKTLTTASSTTS